MSSLTYEQAIAELRRAHGAGDTARAREMAQLANSLKQGGPQPQSQDNPQAPDKSQPPAPEKEYSTFASPTNTIKRLGVGLAKPIIGIAEVATQPFAQLTGRENLARKAGDWAIQKEKQLMEESGMAPDAWNIAGTIGELASPLPGGVALGGLRLAGKAGAKASGALTKKVAANPIASSAATGALYGVATPQGTAPEGEEDNFWTNKASGAAAGAILGGALGKGAQILANPTVSKQVQALKDSGMKYLTPGQLAHDIPLVGRGLGFLEQAATSLPISGSIIRGAINRSDQDFTAAAINKTLTPLGEKITQKEIKKVGEDNLNGIYKLMHEKIGKRYDKVEPKISLSKSFNGKSIDDDIKNLIEGKNSSVYSTMKKSDREDFSKQLQDIVIGRMENDKLNGAAFRRVEQDLNTMKKSLYSKGEHQQADAVNDVLQMIRSNLEKQNPGVGKELRNIHTAYRNSLPIEKAIANAGLDAQGGITPAQYNRAIKAVEGQRAAALQSSPAYGLINDARDVFGSRMGTSFTSERSQAADLIGKIKSLGTGAVELGGAGLSGGLSLAAPLAVSGALYNPLSQRAITKLATERPELLKKLSPYLSQIGAGIGGLQGGAMHVPGEGYEAHRKGGLVQYAEGGIVDDYLNRKVAEATLAKLNSMPPGMPMGMPAPVPQFNYGGLASTNPIYTTMMDGLSPFFR